MSEPSLPPNATVEQKLDFLIHMSVNTAKEVKETNTLLENLTKRVTALETETGAIQNEMKLLKNTVNRLEQQNRNLSIRVMGLPLFEGENTTRLVYDRILKPILVKAKDSNKIGAVPQLTILITDAYRIRPRGGLASTVSDMNSVLPPPLMSSSSSLQPCSSPSSSQARRRGFPGRRTLRKRRVPANFWLWRSLLPTPTSISRAYASALRWTGPGRSTASSSTL